MSDAPSDAPEAPGFQVRDFGPGQVPQWAPPSPDDSGELRYHTQAAPFSSTPPTPPVVIDSVPIALAPPPRSMTRRELRALETSQGLHPEPADGPQDLLVDVPASVKVPEAVPAEAQAPTALPVAPAPTAPPVAPAPISLLVVPALIFPPASTPVPNIPAPIRSGAPGADFAATDRGVDLAPQVFAAPSEHWAAAPNGEPGPGSAGFIRSVGTASGALTTSALVIPSVPQASDMTRPFSNTGEILITGSIDLPRSLGTTGALPARFDHSDIDALFAAEDKDHSSSDSAPVRAIRAVSTHTSTHGMISAKKPENNKLPMMMAVTAGILAVGVAALFAAALIFGYF